MLWQKPAFYGHPTLSNWFTSEYKKSGKKLDMGKGCVRFKSLQDLALDYPGAISRDLPIGSGLIESGHKHVLQARLKKAGSA